jgi:hypothetical protein
MRTHIAIKVCTNLDHHAITVVLNAGVVADDLGVVVSSTDLP